MEPRVRRGAAELNGVDLSRSGVEVDDSLFVVASQQTPSDGRRDGKSCLVRLRWIMTIIIQY